MFETSKGVGSRGKTITIDRIEEILEVRHKCTLPPEEDPVVMYINQGYFVHYRRKLHRMCTVSDINPRSKVYLKSSTAIGREKKRHMKYYSYMIHPFSTFRQSWELFMIFVLAISIVVTPLSLVMENTRHIKGWSKEFTWNYLTIVRIYVCLPIIWLDIFMNFITGDCKYATKEIILSFKQISRNYIFGSFFIKVLSALPMDFVVSDIFDDYIKVEEEPFYDVAGCTVLLQIKTLYMYVDGARDWLEYSHFKVKMWKLITTCFTYTLWLSCYMQIINQIYETKIDSKPIVLHLLDSLDHCLNTVLLIGYGYRPYETIVYRVIRTISMVIGVILRFMMMSFILQLMSKRSSAGAKYQLVRQQLQEYTNYKLLPEFLKKKMLHYYHCRFRKTYLKEKEIWHIMSNYLKQEIILHSCRRLVEKVDFFKDLPMIVLVRIVRCMKQEFYLPNDIIVMAGTIGDTMYFLANGTVAIYIKTGQEVCHLEDGENFGEIALVMENEARTASVVAVEPCEVFCLNRKDFQKAIEPYPELLSRIRKIAFNRLQKTMALMAGDLLVMDDKGSRHSDTLKLR